jgi:hypothetical protein
MATTVQHHPVTWHAPSPLWRAQLRNGSPDAFHRPTLLRFASDDFMADLERNLAADPRALADLVARHETWRDEVGFSSIQIPQNGTPVKLFQPSHQRFYLVAGSLVCQTRGLPDRRIDGGKSESASFVLRRLVAEAGTTREYGWFGDGKWRAVPVQDRVDLPDANGTPLREERLPLFAMPFALNGHPRRLLAGFIPVAGRERFEAAPRQNQPALPTSVADDELADPRLVVHAARFEDALGSLGVLLGNAKIAGSERREAGREILAFILLDLMEQLQRFAAPVFEAVNSSTASVSSTVYNALLQRLRNATLIGSTRWNAGLKEVWNQRSALEEGDSETAFNNLSWLRDAQVATLNAVVAAHTVPSGTNVSRSLRQYFAATPVPAPEAVSDAPPVVDAAGDATYVIRCVYERPRCEPYLRAPIVSAPSRPFRMASFFDPDAPARPIRISLPVDTSISGLRKFPKNVSILVSDKLRQQIKRVEGLTMSAVEDGDLNARQGFDLGMICSLSIPIITICALILLMIIVQLLNIVFFWVPFFKICLPCNLKR